MSDHYKPLSELSPLSKIKHNTLTTATGGTESSIYQQKAMKFAKKGIKNVQHKLNDETGKMILAADIFMLVVSMINIFFSSFTVNLMLLDSSENDNTNDENDNVILSSDLAIEINAWLNFLIFILIVMIFFMKHKQHSFEPSDLLKILLILTIVAFSIYLLIQLYNTDDYLEEVFNTRKQSKKLLTNTNDKDTYVIRVGIIVILISLCLITKRTFLDIIQEQSNI